MSFYVYPRHYTSRRFDGDEVVVSSGDESVEMLFASYLDRSVNIASWDFRRAILLHAKRLFGDLHEWFRLQLHNPNVVGYNQAFVLDTVGYLKTGQRQMSVTTWFDLIQEGGKGHTANAVPTALQGHKGELTSSSSDELLQTWVSKPNGFEDLLNTLHLLFGRARAA